jgi:hypothetical protein
MSSILGTPNAESARVLSRLIISCRAARSTNSARVGSRRDRPLGIGNMPAGTSSNCARVASRMTATIMPTPIILMKVMLEAERPI